MNLASHEWLLALWLIPLLLGLVIAAHLRRRTMLQRFADPALQPARAGRSGGGRVLVRRLLCVVSALFVVVALARPQWGEEESEVNRRGRDVCFLLDVSRSMLATDLVPSRLERAKFWIRDVLSVARGDRVAIVAFAGEAVVKCPLTHDYGFAATALEDAVPTSVSRGGTLIGDAIRACMNEVFDKDDPSHKDIILITDGEDHESLPVEAAEAAGAAGIRIIAIGIGDETRGRPVMLVDPATGKQSPLKYKGEPVMTRLDASTLRKVASASNRGVYFNVATGTIELEKVYQDLVREAEQRELESTVQSVRVDRFQVFLGAALALLMIAHLVRERGGA